MTAHPTGGGSGAPDTRRPELAAWLLERIAEDEAACEAASDDPEWVGGRLVPFRSRLLAECEVRRRIVALHDDLLRREVDKRDASAMGAALMHLDVLRALAQPYAGAPGWREEWAL